MNNQALSTLLVLAVTVTALFFVFYLPRKKVNKNDKYTENYWKDSKKKNAAGLGISLGVSFGLIMGL